MAMLKWIDKELSLSVYLGSSHNVIELNKDDILCLMFNKISCDKGMIKYTVIGYVWLLTLHDLGSHNVLLEATYVL